MADPQTPARTLFIRGVSQYVREKQIQKKFQSAGRITKIKNPGKGYIFVTFETIEEATICLQRFNGAKSWGLTPFHIEYSTGPREKDHAESIWYRESLEDEGDGDETCFDFNNGKCKQEDLFCERGLHRCLWCFTLTLETHHHSRQGNCPNKKPGFVDFTKEQPRPTRTARTSSLQDITVHRSGPSTESRDSNEQENADSVARGSNPPTPSHRQSQPRDVEEIPTESSYRERGRGQTVSRNSSPVPPPVIEQGVGGGLGDRGNELVSSHELGDRGNELVSSHERRRSADGPQQVRPDGRPYVGQEHKKLKSSGIRRAAAEKNQHQGGNNDRSTDEESGMETLDENSMGMHISHRKNKAMGERGDECGRGFKSMWDLTTHKASHSDEKSFVCPCGKAYKTSIALNAHVKSEHEGQTYDCPDCDRPFKVKSSMMRHWKNVCNREDQEFKCAECGIKFNQNNNLTRHIKEVHNRELPHKCDICGQRFSRKADVQIHIKGFHEDARPHICQDCGAAYRTAYALDHHRIRQHTKQWYWNCDYCDPKLEVGFLLPSHLKRHLLAKHPAEYKKQIEEEKPAVCPKCHKRFPSEEEVEIHLKKMHTE